MYARIGIWILLLALDEYLKARLEGSLLFGTQLLCVSSSEHIDFNIYVANQRVKHSAVKLIVLVRHIIIILFFLCLEV